MDDDLRCSGAGERSSEPGPPTIANRLLVAIRTTPGRTEIELARDLFGDRASQARVNFTCRLLEARDFVQRRGLGGLRDPYRYYPGREVERGASAVRSLQANTC